MSPSLPQSILSLHFAPSNHSLEHTGITLHSASYQNSSFFRRLFASSLTPLLNAHRFASCAMKRKWTKSMCVRATSATKMRIGHFCASSCSCPTMHFRCTRALLSRISCARNSRVMKRTDTCCRNSLRGHEGRQFATGECRQCWRQRAITCACCFSAQFLRLQE